MFACSPKIVSYAIFAVRSQGGRHGPFAPNIVIVFMVSGRKGTLNLNINYQPFDRVMVGLKETGLWGEELWFKQNVFLI